MILADAAPQKPTKSPHSAEIPEACEWLILEFRKQAKGTILTLAFFTPYLFDRDKKLAPSATDFADSI
jgi:hypothetical protein